MATFHVHMEGLMVLEEKGAERVNLVSFSTNYVPKLRWTRRMLASDIHLTRIIAEERRLI